jgi:hypothetical protein
MCHTYDIIRIDEKIQNKLTTEAKSIDKLRKKLCTLRKKINTPNLRYSQEISLKSDIENLTLKIRDTQKNLPLCMYISRTYSILSQYKNHINTAMPINFLLKPLHNINTQTPDVFILTEQYISIAKEYINIDTIYTPLESPPITVCQGCKSSNIQEDVNMRVCGSCGMEISVLAIESSFKDIDRVNITKKYKYDRISHFKDVVYQYQGKQTNTVPLKVVKGLKKELKSHGLVLPSGLTKVEKYKKVTPKHIFMFLKEIDARDYYTDCTLIHCIITGTKAPDISCVEVQIIEDFKTLYRTYIELELYNDIYQGITRKRKNFLNSQYVLFQLLKKYKYRCKKEEFNILKTRDRRLEHDDIYSKLSKHLKWPFTSTV